jgi:hypothetical protein
MDIFQEKQDWGRILDELKAAGVSTYKVAIHLGRDWDTVNGWREHEPRYSDGQALLKLHASHTRKAAYG